MRSCFSCIFIIFSRVCSWRPLDGIIKITFWENQTPKFCLKKCQPYLFASLMKSVGQITFWNLCWDLSTVGVHQGSIVGPLLFNISSCHLLLSKYSSGFTSFADDTTPCECGKNYDEVISNLEDIIEKLFNWFLCDNFKANASNCHLLLFI